MLAAFSTALRVTLAGSMMPAWNILIDEVLRQDVIAQRLIVLVSLMPQHLLDGHR